MILFEVVENVLKIEKNKASFRKAGFNVIGRYSGLKCVVKTGEKIFFGNMSLITSYKIFDIKRIRAFQYQKTGYVKRLKSVRGMGRHTKRNNVVILTVLFELDRVMAFVTVKNKKTFGTLSTRPSMLVKVFDSFQT